jgi:hypothetical protein
MTTVERTKWIGYASAAIALLLMILMRYRRRRIEPAQA